MNDDPIRFEEKLLKNLRKTPANKYYLLQYYSVPLVTLFLKSGSHDNFPSNQKQEVMTLLIPKIFVSIFIDERLKTFPLINKFILRELKNSMGVNYGTNSDIFKNVSKNIPLLDTVFTEIESLDKLEKAIFRLSIISIKYEDLALQYLSISPEVDVTSDDKIRTRLKDRGELAALQFFENIVKNMREPF